MHKYPLIFLLALLFSCTSKPEKKQEIPWNTDQSIELNKRKARNELRKIQQLGNRFGWDLQNSGSGAHYFLSDTPEKKEFPREGDEVQLLMNVLLPNGDTVYSHTRYGWETVRIGKDESESGLHEILPKIPFGAQAKIVLPSYLAFGLVGDQQEIPPNSIVIYDVIDLRRLQK